MARTKKSKSRKSRSQSRTGWKYGSGYNSSKRNYKKLIALVAPPVLAVGAAVTTISVYLGQDRIDENFCFNGAPQAQHNLAYDFSYTKGLSDNLQRDYERIPQQAFAQAPDNTRFNFFTTASDAESSLARPVATICKPPKTVAGAEALGVPSKPQAYLDNQSEDARAAFDLIANNLLEDAQNPDKAASDSAILELVQGVSRYPHKGNAGRKLTLISDGLQNSDIKFCQLPGHLPPFSTFRTQDRYRVLAPDSFDGVEVDIMLVEHARLPAPSMEHCTNQEVRRFWVDYFEGNGAVNVRLTRLRYGAGQ